MMGVMRRVIFCAALALFAGLGLIAVPAGAQTLTPAERARLEAQYAELQEEIAQWQKVLTETRNKKGTLQGDVTLLNAQIKQAEAQIRQKNLAITKLGNEINAKTAHIGALSERIERGKESLASIMRQKSQLEALSVVEVALSSKDVSEFFSDLDSFAFIKRDMQELFVDIRAAQDETELERAALADRQNQELDAKYVVETKKKQVASDEAEKQRLLAITKNEEAQYAKVLAEREAEAAAIRARLFPLRDTAAIQFGEAVKYAEEASAKTGVRAAFILAILKQESDLGGNVGNCLVTDLTTGNGKGKNTGTPFTGVMKVPRDTEPFARITAALGKDWSTTPVSCPQPGGYGGAMGPTQFIPSTWALFEPRLKVALGVPATNPWNAGHAIMATGLFLQDVGAAAQTYTAEREAAGRYYAGGAWATRGLTYAASVLAHAEKFQRDIDFLKDN